MTKKSEKVNESQIDFLEPYMFSWESDATPGKTWFIGPDTGKGVDVKKLSDEFWEEFENRIEKELEDRIAIQVYDYSQKVCNFLKDNSEEFKQFTETLQEIKE